MPKFHGFTLIELLIVITIIGILSALGMASYSTAQAKARDAQRKSDFTQIKKALVLAKSESTGASFYPQNGVLVFGAPFPNGGSDNGAYMKFVPLDPKNAAPYVYAYTPTNCAGNWPTSGCTSYFLQTTLERAVDPDAAASQAKCPGAPGGPTYVVCPD